MTSVCLCFVTILVILIEINALRRINDFGSFRSVVSSDGRPILRGGANDLTASMDSNPAGRPALRGGLDDLLENVDVDINVRLQPKEKRKHDPDSHKMAIPLRDDEKLQQNADFLLRKRQKSSSEESDDDDGLPIMRTVMPDSSPEKIKSQETEEVITYLQTGGNKDDSSGEQTISLVREGDDNSYENPAKFQRQQSVKSTKMPEWTKDLKKYIRILSSKYPRNGMINHIKPVIKVLERTHKVKIKDIDVDKRGRVKVLLKKGSKGK
ncbi:uncharacterized protein LOC133529550 isoform X1 [Cydia pomonella]|uniref:uncharacterized protein LOC133529550 isoform X1 n=1 Tax=Cydia pomonella TaxID=82600 RepID=UPI002ADE66C3|nr:uncharacterized protein LOC133529550 isoform X1 [Cydia pomonella]